MRKEEGTFTVEGSFIFTWIVILVAAFLRLDFSLHDWAVTECCIALGGFRMEQMANYSYSSTTEGFDVNEVMATPLIGDKKVEASYAERIHNLAQAYYDAHKIGNGAEPLPNFAEEMHTPKKNAQLLRAGTKIIQLIGKDDKS